MKREIEIINLVIGQFSVFFFFFFFFFFLKKISVFHWHRCKSWLLNISGWHRRINGKAGKTGLGFYVLVPLLQKEAEGVNLQMRLLSENLLTDIHRKKYRQILCRLFDLGDKYDDGDITTSQLLRACGKISGLGPSATSIKNYE